MKILGLIVTISLILGFAGCIWDNGNDPPSVPSIACPVEVKMNEEAAIAVRSADPNRDRIAYKVAFGDGIESDWSDYVLSGDSVIFVHTYSQAGNFEVKAIASDTHRDNSGWSDSVTIKVLPRPPPVGQERIVFCVAPDDDFARIAEMGITIVQSYVSSYHIQHFLDEAERNGLKVLNSVVQIQWEILETGTWNRGNMEAQIEVCKDHPAFWGWHIFEELNLREGEISHSIQKEVYGFFKQRDPGHSIVQTISGFVKKTNGGFDWDKINFNALDVLMPDLYPYDGDGDCWGMKPLVALELGASQERRYLDNNSIRKPVIFIMQICDEPAVTSGNYNTKVPLGEIEAQFRILEKYGLFAGGVGAWAWNHGYFSPCTSNEMFDEVKNLFDKIK